MSRASTKYWWGDDAEAAKDRANVGDQALAQAFPGSQAKASWNDTFAATAAAGGFKPNAMGLYGIGGNVWEWCQDRWADRLPPGRLVDPAGPNEGGARTFKGSSFVEFPPKGLSFRYGNTATIGANNRGFRVVVSDEWRSLTTEPSTVPADTLSRGSIGAFVAVSGQIVKYTPSPDARAPHILTLVDRKWTPLK